MRSPNPLFELFRFADILAYNVRIIVFKALLILN